jgi:flavin-dependent dehydrogenase
MKTVSIKCDVAILGAGPAGLATAICCAEFGLQVCILERGTFPRPAVGECVHPGAEELFRRLGVAKEIFEKKFLRFSGVWNGHERELSFVPFGGSSKHPWKGFQLWRYDFDQILLKRSLELGATFVCCCYPSEAIPTNRGVNIITKAGNFETRIVVDGTGRNSWIARQWGLKRETFSHSLVARYGYCEGDCPQRHDNPLFSMRREGWDWTARVRPNLYQWISVRLDEKSTCHHPIPSEMRNLRQVSRVRGADVTWRFVSECASRRHFLVGDAVSVLDPSSSHGVIKALSSGIVAAECIKKTLNQHSGAEKAIQGYSAWQWKWFKRDAHHLRTLFKRAGYFPGRAPA